jgi:hypothetical protein
VGGLSGIVRSGKHRSGTRIPRAGTGAHEEEGCE